MNTDDAMKKVDSQLSKMGYEHPTESNSSRHNQYMNYSVSEDQKTSGMGEYTAPTFYDPYASFNADEKTNDTQKTDICPVCDQKAMYSCNCLDADMMCKQGHIWFVLKNGTVKVGDPHEDELDD